MLYSVVAVGVLAAAMSLSSLACDGSRRDESRPPGVEASGRAPELRWGAQLHPLWPDTTLRTVVRELDHLRRAGADTVRADLAWASLEPRRRGRRSRWFVRTTDAFMRHAARRGLEVVAVFAGTPCWASSAPSRRKRGCRGAWWRRAVDEYAPTDPRDYADAAVWVARRWGSRLAALELWNEPNEREFLRSSRPARAYARLIRAAYPRLKRARPELTVVAGALGSADGRFLSALYRAGANGHFDAFSIHPYSGARPPAAVARGPARKHSFAAGVPWIRRILARHGDGEDLWLTELGWSTCSGGAARGCVSAEEQAAYLEQAHCLVRGWPYVKAALVYSLRDKRARAVGREAGFGLLTRAFRPKPAWRSFGEAISGDGCG